MFSKTFLRVYYKTPTKETFRETFHRTPSGQCLSKNIRNAILNSNRCFVKAAQFGIKKTWEIINCTARKVSRYGVFSGLYFLVFGLNIYSVNLHIQSEYRKIRTRKNSVFGNFSRSVECMTMLFEWNSIMECSNGM